MVVVAAKFDGAAVENWLILRAVVQDTHAVWAVLKLKDAKEGTNVLPINVETPVPYIGEGWVGDKPPLEKNWTHFNPPPPYLGPIPPPRKNSERKRAEKEP
jgi:hypothetical protein